MIPNPVSLNHKLREILIKDVSHDSNCDIRLALQQKRLAAALVFFLLIFNVFPLFHKQL